jgi:hypothetical protein
MIGTFEIARHLPQGQALIHQRGCHEGHLLLPSASIQAMEFFAPSYLKDAKYIDLMCDFDVNL